MGRARRHPAVAGIDPEALAAFQAGIRKRYTDEEILTQLTGSAARLGRSPTMREFAADSQTTVHPQTVIEHFGSWNAAKRAIGYGYTGVRWYEEGIEGWQDAGHETYVVKAETPPS